MLVISDGWESDLNMCPCDKVGDDYILSGAGCNLQLSG